MRPHGAARGQVVQEMVHPVAEFLGVTGDRPVDIRHRPAQLLGRGPVRRETNHASHHAPRSVPPEEYDQVVGDQQRRRLQCRLAGSQRLSGDR
ncbi:MAG TPA: hypothetical protein VEJ84_19735 [Acidimicrobiales bacterium]|nr:hypothetical protein [Acidimicrobiales bacterium]